MLKRRNNSFKKNMAVLVCVAFVLMFFSGVTHASAEPSSAKFPSIKKTLPLFSSFFSLFKFNFLGDDPDPKKEDEKKKDDKKSNDTYDDGGNRTSKKKTNGKD
jgi:hypothetical protein